MVVVALDTSTRAGSVAVLQGETVLTERVFSGDEPHGTRLPADLFHALEDAGVRPVEVELYAVASGPGAFTGLRIGIATIQGLAFAHGRPAIGVSALDALGHAARQRRLAQGACIGAWMDAARGEIFAALYEVVGRGTRPRPYVPEDELTMLDPPSVGDPVAVLAGWRRLVNERPIVFAGDGAIRYGPHIRAALGDMASGSERAGSAAIVTPTPPLAAIIGRLAAQRAAAGEAGPPHAIRPLYVRRPDAELARARLAVKASEKA